MKRAVRWLALSLLTLSLLAQAQTLQWRVTSLTYDEAKPILQAMSEILPVELRAVTPSERASVWPKWVAQRDAEIRARLLQGDEDSLVNFLLFGTSFTRRPRVTLQALAQLGRNKDQAPANPSADAAASLAVVQARADDLARALAAPGENERLLVARRLVEKKGHQPSNRAQVKEYLLAGVARVLDEQATYAKVLESARLLGNATEEFIERSKLYRHRGLSSDTSLLPNFALEQSLATIKARGLLAPGSVRRVAIIGPGLDFTDKQDGYDFYPPQTIQPFAIMDTLLRLSLARLEALQLTTFDLSPRVNDHLRRAQQRAQRGLSYVVQLPRDPQATWRPEAIAYWASFGDRIGTSVPPVAVPAGAGEVKVRAVRLRPAIVSLVTPADVNIVLQRLDLPAGAGFDLIIATNIFVYYDVFEQSLAAANVERMLRPGGFLLSNNALLELPHSRLHSIGYQTTVYSDRPNDGDHTVWYQRSPSR